MVARVPQVNFSKGELSPEIAARFDVQAYGSAVKRARNVRIMKTGGLTKRMGTRIVAPVKDQSQPVRLVPFQFSLEQTYILEMGQGYMRPAALGGLVLEEELAVAGAVTGTTTTLEVAYHDYSVGDRLFLTDGDGALGAALNGRFWTVTAVPDATHITINANTTGLTYSGWDGGITRSAPPPAPPPPPPPPPDPVPPPSPPPTGGGGTGTKVYPGTKIP